jgi:hypothetical protein
MDLCIELMKMRWVCIKFDHWIKWAGYLQQRVGYRIKIWDYLDLLIAVLVIGIGSFQDGETEMRERH